MDTNKVALIKGKSRKQNILRALKLLGDDLLKDLKTKLDKKKNPYLLIKPNFVTTRRQLAATHVDAIRAVLDFLKDKYQGKIIIGEAASIGRTKEGFKNYGYFNLLREYKNIELVDLNTDESVEIKGIGKKGKPIRLQISKLLAKAPYRISVGPMKTHDRAIMTASIKNMAVGALQKGGFRPLNFASKLILRRSFRDYKAAIHSAGYHELNRNIAKLYQYTKADLAVVDAYEAMERNGPVGGNSVEMQLAFASLNPIATDTLAAHLMGFDEDRVGYLHMLGANFKKVRVLGAKVENCQRKFRPHDSYVQQLDWEG